MCVKLLKQWYTQLSLSQWAINVKNAIVKIFFLIYKAELFLIGAALCILLGLTSNVDITIQFNLKHSLTVVGVLLAWSVFICSPRLRLLLAITSIMGFNIWLILQGMDKITVTQTKSIVVSKETAFIIAMAILAWLAISCYSLSLLKDSQLENDKES